VNLVQHRFPVSRARAMGIKLGTCYWDLRNAEQRSQCTKKHKNPIGNTLHPGRVAASAPSERQNGGGQQRAPQVNLPSKITAVAIVWLLHVWGCGMVLVCDGRLPLCVGVFLWFLISVCMRVHASILCLVAAHSIGHSNSEHLHG
jgi:hypothetical protein